MHHNTAAMMEHGAGEGSGLPAVGISRISDLQRSNQKVQERQPVLTTRKGSENEYTIA